MSRTLVAALVLAAAVPAAAQQNTDIWLAPLKVLDGAVTLGEPVNVSNRFGYDNQPSFSPDGRYVYWTTRRDDGQTDLVRYDIRRKETLDLTRTRESEYSPTRMLDGSGDLSAIVVEADSTQRLWRIPSDRSPRAPLFPTLKPVGYHAWANERLALLFVLGTGASPNAAVLADLKTGKIDTIARGIGRTIARHPITGELTWSERAAGAAAITVKAINPLTRAIRTVGEGLPGRGEFFAWTPGGRLLMADGATLWQRPANGPWTKVRTFGDRRLSMLSRIAVSPKGDYIAFVSEDPGIELNDAVQPGPDAMIPLPAPAPAPTPAPTPTGTVPAPAQAMTVVVVRHAEKASGTGDVPLSEAGLARAKALAAALADAQVRRVVVSTLARTRQTAEPLATARGLPMQAIGFDGGTEAHVQAVAKAVLEAGSGTVLVVGHSNTVPAILAALGAPRMPDLCEAVYDGLYVLTIPPAGARALVRATFGAPTPEPAGCRPMKP